jgi:hypothetical protein
MNRSVIAPALLAAAAALPAAAAGPKASGVFGALKPLVGEWRSADPANATRVSYALVANGSALVETWTMSPSRTSMTVYTMDGDRLLATHYCPQGNAPRMRWTHTDTSGAHHFLFVDGANLQDPEGFHEHAFWIRVERAGAITRSETYIGNGATFRPGSGAGEPETFERVRGGAE